jgi:acyl carrier protein
MATDVLDRIKGIIQEKADIDAANIQLESRLVDDLGLDSLALVELMLAFEETFELEISEPETEKLQTVNDVVELVTARHQRLTG